MREFLRWCAQFREFEYGTTLYWVDVYERGDGTDMYGRRLPLMDGRVFKPK